MEGMGGEYDGAGSLAHQPIIPVHDLREMGNGGSFHELAGNWLVNAGTSMANLHTKVEPVGPLHIKPQIASVFLPCYH